MPSRVRSNPFATLLAVVSAILIALGRFDRDAWWGDGAFVAGIAMLVLAGLIYLRERR